MLNTYIESIFDIKDNSDFEALALKAYQYQRDSCAVYNQYLKATERYDSEVSSLEDIPFLPIKLFKNRMVISGENPSDEQLAKFKIFTSSATTSMTPSKHYVRDLSLYEKSFIRGFEHFYGDLANYHLLALLPSYLEREGSSLVYMADKLIRLIRESGGSGGFYLYNHEELLDKIVALSNLGSNRKIILLGVSFALLDFGNFVSTHISEENCDAVSRALENIIVIETGGMKGRGKELSRNELHGALKKNLHTSSIHSEYGMAELLSQAYLQEGELFKTPPWMRVMVRDLYDPFKIRRFGKGAINIIDLANIHSCCFIQIDDIGKVLEEGPFCIDGRIAHSELRGCNMLLE